MKKEKRLYSKVKRARWILLAGKDSLSDDEASCLKKILDDHAGLALCHAMKEEMARLFDLRDEDEASCTVPCNEGRDGKAFRSQG